MVRYHFITFPVFNMEETRVCEFLRLTSRWNKFLILFGLTSLTVVTTKQTTTIQSSPVKTLVSLLFALTYFVFFFIQAVGSFNEPGGLASRLVNAYVFDAGLLYTSLLVFVTVVQRKDAAKVFTTIIAFEEAHESKLRPSSTFYYLFWASGFVFVLSFLADAVQFIPLDFPESCRIFLAFYTFPFYNFLILGQFSFSLSWISKSFINLNETLLGIQEELVDAEENKKAPVKAQRDLLRLRALYHHLHLLSLRLGAVYGPRIVLLTCHNLLAGTVHFYLGMAEWQQQAHDVGLSVIVMPMSWVFFKWGLMSVISLLALVYPCHATCSHVLRMSDVVQLMHIKTKDPTMQKELENFSVQLELEKMEFTPCGLFTLSNRFTLTVLSAATSYLVVLTQFRVTL